jgi:hypothetical protein
LDGAGEAEKDAQVYLKSVRLGGKVISVQVAEGEAERSKQLPAIENVLDAQILYSIGA